MARRGPTSALTSATIRSVSPNTTLPLTPPDPNGQPRVTGSGQCVGDGEPIDAQVLAHDREG